MNTIARKILRELEATPMREMSVHFLRKQCNDSGLDVDTLSLTDLESLLPRFERILPFFIGKEASHVMVVLRSIDDEVEA